MPDIARDRARNPDRIEPRMPVETPVFDRDDGMLQVR
jgi:hypothetical protein